MRVVKSFFPAGNFRRDCFANTLKTVHLGAGVNIYFENGVSWQDQNIQYSFPVNDRPSKLAPIGLFIGAVTKGILRII